MDSESLKGYLAFADGIFTETVKRAENENVLISPYSMFVLAAMLCEGTAGKTKAEISRATAAGMKDSGGIDAALEEMNGKLQDGGSAEFRIANALAVKQKFAPHILKKYTEVLRKSFGADVFSSGDIVKETNAWVEKKTAGMIPRALDAGVSPDICLVDAVSFMAKWRNKYGPENITEKGVFANSEGRDEEAVMLGSTEKTWLKKGELIGFTRPYRGGKYDFMAVVPESEETKLRSALPNISFLREIYLSGETKKTIVTMPEFTFDFGMDMNEILKAMGIREVFREGAADLSRMLDVPDTYVEKILHKTHIENDRQGTKAAAVSIAEMTYGCVPDFENIRYVALNRPFVFAIIHRETALPIFAGVVNSVGKAK